MSGGVWRKTLVYLGLVEEPEEHDDLPEQFETGDAQDEPADRGRAANVRPLRVPEPGAAHVRAMARGDVVRVSIVEVSGFEDCELIGSRYRGGQPVVFDLSQVDQATARRVLDFVSGTTYALRGRLRRAGERAFLLLPDGAHLPPEEARRLAAMGYGVDA